MTEPEKPNVLLQLHERMFSFLRLKSMKGKIFTLFVLSLLSVTVLTVFDFWNLSTLKTRLLLSERYDDLLHNILEVRRYEKNFIIYGDHRSLTEGMEYLDMIATQVDGLAPDLQILVGSRDIGAFQSDLAEYRKLFEEISKGEEGNPLTLRELGKSLTVAADRFRRIKRQRIHTAIRQTSIFPVAFLAIFLPLMGLVLWLVSYGMVRPLTIIRRTTQSVGRGDFSPIHYQGGVRLEEISGLIEAFNSMARELELNQEDLIQARKIAAIGTFTAGIAHELNNPINNIVLTAESFKEEYGELMDDNCHEMLHDILSQGERAAEIVKNLLDFSRTENPTFTRLRPSTILDSSIRLVKNQIRMVDIDLAISVGEDLPDIIGNHVNLQQVFTNLLLNAIQATPSGGLIDIRVQRSDKYGFVDFMITDSGPGIAPEIQHKVFEPFFSTKEVGKGTGLGLSVCYSIIKRHNGTIKVTSEPGNGATFTVTLPSIRENISEDFTGWTAS